MITAPTLDTLSAALLSIGQTASAADIAQLAAEMARHGSADRLGLALAHDGSGRTLVLLNAWRAFQAEAADPSLSITRLKREAAALDSRAEPAWAEAAEMHGKAAARRLRGEPDLATDFDHRALAAERLAVALEDEALGKRLEAARLEAGDRFRNAVVYRTTRRDKLMNPHKKGPARCMPGGANPSPKGAVAGEPRSKA